MTAADGEAVAKKPAGGGKRGGGGPKGADGTHWLHGVGLV